MENPSRPKLIAFDLVGTLIKGEIFRDARSSINIDFNEGWGEAESASLFNSHFDYESVFRYWLNHAPVKAIYQQFKNYLLEHTLDGKYLYPDTEPTLKGLSNLGIRLGFVTDGHDEVEGEMIRTILRRCNIDPNNCIIISGDKVKSGKVTGQPFARLAEEAVSLGITAQEITFVGDKLEIDVKGAKQKNLITALIRRSYVEDEPEHQINSLEELLSIVNYPPQS
jgi:FMN phosphatase YigB (HAD superfamily)